MRRTSYAACTVHRSGVSFLYVCAYLVGVSFNLKQQVAIANDTEVETNVIVYACLPNARRFIIFLCTKRRMSQICKQKVDLLSKCGLDFLRKFTKRAIQVRGRFVRHFSRC